jgi:2',3'-cyclic-nucleotide 2'-phosphodiesterase
MLNILFIGDIVGKIGRETVAEILPALKKELKVDIVAANAENCAHGNGVNEDSLKFLMKAGVDFFTTGDHAFDNKKQTEHVYNNYPIIRPANFPDGNEGLGYSILEKGKNRVLFINLIGRVFMQMDYDCPFRKLDEILANNSLSNQNLSAIIVDVHAEASSEKIAMKYYADGRVSAIIGTHTHVPTADAVITDKNTAFLSDIGMVGFAAGVIGVNKEGIIKTFLTQIKTKHSLPEIGPSTFNAVLIKINPKNKKAVNIKPIIKQIEIT